MASILDLRYWISSCRPNATRKEATGPVQIEAVKTSVAERWLGEKVPLHLGTNHQSSVAPIADWYRFKEAFAPELVRRAILQSSIPVRQCLDPFGGAGTTALTCQMHGISSTSIEVNPFLADLIEAKTARYDIISLEAAINRMWAHVKASDPSPASTFFLPETFVEPGVNDRWVFNKDVAQAIQSITLSISLERDLSARRLFRVALGSILASVSNVVINGKGRRYRKNWAERSLSKEFVFQVFDEKLTKIVKDIVNFSDRPLVSAEIVRGDARRRISECAMADLAVFSPPYPNSFDYTDVYNLELWMLGYLRSRAENAELRHMTLSSHVQITRAFSAAPGSQLLQQVIYELDAKKSELWHPKLIGMVGAYFAEISAILLELKRIIRSKGQVWIVVGNSRYAGTEIPSADVLSELARQVGFDIVANEPIRAMRTSPQQGGQPALEEKLLILRQPVI